MDLAKLLLHNTLYYAESLWWDYELKQNMKVIDLGCSDQFNIHGQRIRVQVYAVDRGILDNFNRIMEMNLLKKSFP
jgi:hypothetical protein